MAERTDPTKKTNSPFYCQYRAVYEYATQFTQTHNVLDVGCGEGYGAHLLTQSAKQVVAIDRDKKTIQRAKQRYQHPNLHFYVQDVSEISEQLPDSFDTVCCFHVIEHLKNPVKFLAEIRKHLLRPSGVLLISTPNRHSPLRRSTNLRWPYHEREYTANELRELLSTSFNDVTLYALQGSREVKQFQKIRAQHIQQIFKWDLLKLRHRLPKQLLRLSYDLGGTLLKSFMSTTHGDLIDDISVADFHITDQQLHDALDLIAVCRVPHNATIRVPCNL